MSKRRDTFMDLGQYKGIASNINDDIYQEYNNKIFTPLKEISKIYDEIMNKQIFD